MRTSALLSPLLPSLASFGLQQFVDLRARPIGRKRLPGEPGTKGDPGMIGMMGMKGDPGPRAIPAPRVSRVQRRSWCQRRSGGQGRSGAKRATLPQGDPGLAGPKGRQRRAGAQGDAGAPGPRAIRAGGSKGDPGLPGPKGIRDRRGRWGRRARARTSRMSARSLGTPRRATAVPSREDEPARALCCAAAFAGAHLCHASEYIQSNLGTTVPSSGAWFDASLADSGSDGYNNGMASSGRYVGYSGTVRLWTTTASGYNGTYVTTGGGISNGACLDIAAASLLQ